MSGTALTPEQMKLISRYAREIILALDADAAGGEASKRALALAGEFDITVKMLQLGEYKDPDAMIKADAMAWAAAVEQAMAVVDFYFEQAAKKYDLRDLPQKKQLVRELLGLINQLTDPVERDHYIKKLARLVDVEPRVLYDAIAKPKPKLRPSLGATVQSMVGPSLSPTGLEERVVAMALVYPELLPNLMEPERQIKWASGLANSIYAQLTNCYTAKEDFQLDTLLTKLPDSDRTNILEMMLVVEQSYTGVEAAEVARELDFYLSILRQRSYATQRHELVNAIAAAEKSQDQAKLTSLLEELKKL
jgi:DNA primase